MSSKQSFLSLAKYNYDIAVGVTQASVNAIMKQYLRAHVNYLQNDENND